MHVHKRAASPRGGHASTHICATPPSVHTLQTTKCTHMQRRRLCTWPTCRRTHMQRRHLRTRLVHARTNARHRREAAAAAHVPYAFVTTTTTTSPLGLVAGGGKGLVVVVVVMMNALRAIRGWWSARFWRARVSPRGGRGGGGPRRARPCVACWRYGTACIRHLEAAGAEEGLVEHVLAWRVGDTEPIRNREAIFARLKRVSPRGGRGGGGPRRACPCGWSCR